MLDDSYKLQIMDKLLIMLVFRCARLEKLYFCLLFAATRFVILSHQAPKCVWISVVLCVSIH